MCKWSPLFAAFKLMCECANAWSMCKCVVNVRMCKCANVRFKLQRFIACKCFLLQMLSYAKATICTFAHSHICILTKHLHINHAFSH